MAQTLPGRILPPYLMLVNRLDYQTDVYNAFMRKAFDEVVGRFPDRVVLPFDTSKMTLEAIIMCTARYSGNFKYGQDNKVLQANMYHGNKFTVFACALRRAGLSMPALNTLARNVRVCHLRKQSAYKDFARECARRVSNTPFCSRVCVCEFTLRRSLCPWHQLDAALRNMETDIDGNAVFFLKNLKDSRWIF